jgi:hypothetical protein
MAEKATDILIAHAFLYLRDFDGALFPLTRANGH